MTAIVLGPADNGIVAAADAAAYGPNGTVLYFTTKIMLMHEQRCLISSVGIGHFARTYTARASVRDDFDQMIEHLVQESKAAYDECVAGWDRDYPGHTAPRGTLVLGGWSNARQRFEAFKIHSAPKLVLDTRTGETIAAPPWTAIPIETLWSSSLPPIGARERCGVDPNAVGDLGELAVRMVCANRAGAGDYGDGVYGVGGWVDLATVSVDGVVMKRVHEWPDLVGEMIDPSRGSLLPEGYSR